MPVKFIPTRINQSFSMGLALSLFITRVQCKKKIAFEREGEKQGEKGNSRMNKEVRQKGIHAIYWYHSKRYIMNSQKAIVRTPPPLPPTADIH
jgi:hypothetical protein